MSADVQVVEIGENNSLVPNLTISVDAEEEEEGAIPEIEYELPEEEKGANKNEDSASEIKPSLNLFPRKKIYENKSFGGAAELGLSFEEAEARRKKRAQRFHSPLVRTEEEPEDNDKLYEKAEPQLNKIKQFNETISADDDNFIRTDSLHMIGVDSMSTDDIFAYFGKTNPRHIEWVNDSTCNVVWSDGKLCSVSMEKVAHPHDYEEAVEKKEKIAKNEPLPSYDDDLDLEDEEMEVEEPESQQDIVKQDKAQPEVDIPLNPLRKCREPFVKNKVKSHLKVRYALMGDRKELFAAKKSQYYIKHGNPNYGGAKGLLTAKYRKRFQMKSAMKELEDLSVPTSRQYRDEYKEKSRGDSSRKKMKMDDDEENDSRREMEKEDASLIKSTVKDLNSDESDSDDSGDKYYGTMVADQVSERVKAARDMSSKESGRSSIRSRLGKRNHDNLYRSRDSPPHSVMDRLPKDLRSRLGPKREDFRSDRSRGDRRREETRGGEERDRDGRRETRDGDGRRGARDRDGRREARDRDGRREARDGDARRGARDRDGRRESRSRKEKESENTNSPLLRSSEQFYMKESSRKLERHSPPPWE